MVVVVVVEQREFLFESKTKKANKILILNKRGENYIKNKNKNSIQDEMRLSRH